MSKAAGEKFGPYEILSPIGAGGMGEVYKARDTRLDRLVALKVLSESFAKVDDFRARFEREARAVASLNHPNICTLYDIGNQDDVTYMVMELMEGETLATRLERGPIPMEQALAFAAQIADALHRAHLAGVTHRDVKPANIMLTRDGVKVLDFGLAKSAVTATIGPNDTTLQQGLTVENSIIGTPQYMAPEQFEKQEVDARCDVWAFGAVLYEMVTGNKAFKGTSYVTLMSAIVSADPPAMNIKPIASSWLERVVRRCLAKDPDDRWQSMRDIALELRAPVVGSTIAPKTKQRPWIVLGACLGVGLLGFAIAYFGTPPPELPLRVSSILPPDASDFNENAISPDGRLLAFTATTASKRQIWLRPLSSGIARPLDGTAQAMDPFWSPDGRWIGFFASGKLKKIEVTGGSAETLCDAPNARGGTWNAEGVILFSDRNTGLLRISAHGGSPTQLTTIDQSAGETTHRWPSFLPDGRRYVYLLNASKLNMTGIYLGSLDSPERKRLIADATAPVFSKGSDDNRYVLFERQGMLMAQQLKVPSGVTIGGPFPIAEKLGGENSRGQPRFSVSGNGLLIFETGSPNQVQLTWMDRSGELLGTVGEAVQGSMYPQLSSSESHVHSPSPMVQTLTFGCET